MENNEKIIDPQPVSEEIIAAETAAPLTPPDEYAAAVTSTTEQPTEVSPVQAPVSETVDQPAADAAASAVEETAVPQPAEAPANEPVAPTVQPMGSPTTTAVPVVPYTPAIHGITPVNADVPVGKSGKGLKIFALILAFVLVLTLGAGVGFILGKEYRNPTVGIPQVELVPKPTDQAEATVESIYSVVKQSVVRIVVYGEGSDSYSNASGVIYSEDGYIVTNDHIYSDFVYPQFLVQTHDGTQYKAEYVAGDTRSDLAVLKIEATGLTPAEFGNSDELNVGETVVAVGNPDGAVISVATSGIVSAVDIWASGNTSYSTRLIQTDAVLNPGSSGGALANAYGQVIGITSSKMIVDNYDLVNYAIPTTVMKRVVESLIENGYVTGRSMLGISYTEIGDIESELSGMPKGLYLQEITDNKYLTDAGVRKGDIITHVNGTEITQSSVILSVLENTEAGSTVNLTVYMSVLKRSVDVEVVLAEYQGTSSYKTAEDTTQGETSSNNDGTFDFPFGE